MNTLREFGNNTLDTVKKFGNRVKDTVGDASSLGLNTISSIRDSATNTAKELSDKTGTTKIVSKLWNLKPLDENNLLDIVMMLIAIIAIVVVVFYLPKYSKTSSFEKKIFDSKFFKFIICLFLFYAFYFYDLPLFCMCLVIIFLFFWFHHGCFTEHMIGEEIAKELNKKPAVVVRIEGGEIIVDDVDKFKQMIISDKIDEIKEVALSEINQEPSFTDKIKSTASSVASTASSTLSKVASPITNLFSSEEDKPAEIFDQRDFMIMPENAPEKEELFNRICDGTKCSKPSSFVEPMDI